MLQIRQSCGKVYTAHLNKHLKAPRALDKHRAELLTAVQSRFPMQLHLLQERTVYDSCLVCLAS